MLSARSFMVPSKPRRNLKRFDGVVGDKPMFHVLDLHKAKKSMMVKMESEKFRLGSRIRNLERRVLLLQKWITGFSFISIILAIVAKEIAIFGSQEDVVQNWFASVRNFSIPDDALVVTADKPVVLYLKILLTLCTLAQLVMMTIQFSIIRSISREEELLDEALSLGKQNEKRRHSNLRELSPRRMNEFLHHQYVLKSIVEIFLCAIFPLPYLKVKFVMDIVGRPCVYNLESLLSLVVLIRIYHLWRLWKLWMFKVYLGRDSAFIAEDVRRTLNKMVISPRILMIKIALYRQGAGHWQMVWTVSVPTALSLGVTAYALRVFEGPTRSRLSVYFWDQCWLAIVTFFATAYGDFYPVTHLGRLTTSISRVIGALVLSLITARFSRSVALTKGEQEIMFVLDQEAMRQGVLQAASRMIQYWWRRTLPHRSRAAPPPRAGRIWVTWAEDPTWQELYAQLHRTIEAFVAFRKQGHSRLGLWGRSNLESESSGGGAHGGAGSSEVAAAVKSYCEATRKLKQTAEGLVREQHEDMGRLQSLLRQALLHAPSIFPAVDSDAGATSSGSASNLHVQAIEPGRVGSTAWDGTMGDNGKCTATGGIGLSRVRPEVTQRPIASVLRQSCEPAVSSVRHSVTVRASRVQSPSA